MLPLYKLLSLVIRVCSRPMINLTKRYHANNPIQSDRIRTSFYQLGNWFHRMETRINRRYLRMNNANKQIQPLS